MDMAFDALSDVSDEALLVLYANGDAIGARLLTIRLVPRILGYAGRLLGDRAEAEDVAQEAMLRLWRMAPDWRQGEAQVSTWLYRVTTNLCTDRLRSRQRRKQTSLDDAPDMEDGAPLAETVMIQADRISALTAALGTLPERQREAVILRHIEGLSNPEIATVMDLGLEAVESLIARGKRALVTKLSGQREDLGYEESQ
jgi:RNA polymerase sigma factor (sigma-70 family)